MTTEPMLNKIGKHKWADPRHRFKLCDRLSKVLFFEVVDIEVVERLEDALQVLFQSHCSGGCRRESR